MSENVIFEYPLIIREFHLDTLGHVNNATYLAVFEEARWEFITRNGYGLNTVHEKKQSPIILEIDIKFLKELKLRENTIIKTQVKELRGKIFILRQWIENSKGDVCADATVTAGYFDMNTRKLIPMTQEWLSAIGVNS